MVEPRVGAIGSLEMRNDLRGIKLLMGEVLFRRRWWDVQARCGLQAKVAFEVRQVRKVEQHELPVLLTGVN